MDRVSRGRPRRPQHGQDLMEEAGREREYIDKRLFALVRLGFEIEHADCTAVNPSGVIWQVLKPNCEFRRMHNPVQGVPEDRDLGCATSRCPNPKRLIESESGAYVAIVEEAANVDSKRNRRIRHGLLNVALDDRTVGEWKWRAAERPQPCGCGLGLLQRELVDISHRVSFAV